MISLSDILPDYLRGKFQLLSTVTLTAFFSLVMLLVTSHFSVTEWMDLADPEIFLFTTVLFAAALLVIIVSKRVMYVTRYMEMTYLPYILWNFAEIVVISLLYTIMTIEGGKNGTLPPVHARADGIFLNAVLYCTISIGIPYLIAAMYFTIEDKNNTIRLMNFGNVVSDEMPSERNGQKITLFDNSGVLKLSVSETNLYYFESDDNYIKVWYTDANGVLKQYMLRCRLKTVEESFKDSDLVRCHRKYIVNMSHVKVLSREKTGYFLTLDKDDIEPIPITKTYEEHILELFNSR